MTQPYLGEIRMFAGNFAPLGNAYCAGQLMSIAQNSALFSLLGTTYGGDGQQTFGLPDLQGRLPICMGQGPSLSNYPIGTSLGTETVALTPQQMPSHTHPPMASSSPASSNPPGNQVPAGLASPYAGFYIQDANKTGSPIAFWANAVQSVGGSLPHGNLMPALAISLIIALQGIFPSQN